MLPGGNRRDFLKILLAGVVPVPGSAFPGMRVSTAFAAARHGQARAAAAAAKSALAAVRLSDSVIQITGAGGNVVAVTGPDGVVLINAGTTDRSTELLKFVGDQTGGKPVQAVFNTDWHPQHTGANDPLGKSGTPIVAHENTKQYLANDLYVDWQNRTYKALARHALPSKTFYTSGAMTVGRERLAYAHLGQAHTDGDIYVYLPESNVLVVGDLLATGSYPIADYTTGGWLGGLATATKTLIDLANADTRVIASDGPALTRADLQAQFDMLTAMRERFVKMMKQGMGAEDMLAAAITKDFDGKWGSPELFVSTAYRGLWLHVRELGGIV